MKEAEKKEDFGEMEDWGHLGNISIGLFFPGASTPAVHCSASKSRISYYKNKIKTFQRTTMKATTKNSFNLPWQFNSSHMNSSSLTNTHQEDLTWLEILGTVTTIRRHLKHCNVQQNSPAVLAPSRLRHSHSSLQVEVQVEVEKPAGLTHSSCLNWNGKIPTKACRWKLAAALKSLSLIGC